MEQARCSILRWLCLVSTLIALSSIVVAEEDKEKQTPDFIFKAQKETLVYNVTTKTGDKETKLVQKISAVKDEKEKSLLRLSVSEFEARNEKAAKNRDVLMTTRGEIVLDEAPKKRKSNPVISSDALLSGIGFPFLPRKEQIEEMDWEEECILEVPGKDKATQVSFNVACAVMGGAVYKGHRCLMISFYADAQEAEKEAKAAALTHAQGSIILDVDAGKLLLYSAILKRGEADQGRTEITKVLKGEDVDELAKPFSHH